MNIFEKLASNFKKGLTRTSGSLASFGEETKKSFLSGIPKATTNFQDNIFTRDTDRTSTRTEDIFTKKEETSTPKNLFDRLANQIKGKEQADFSLFDYEKIGKPLGTDLNIGARVRQIAEGDDIIYWSKRFWDSVAEQTVKGASLLMSQQGEKAFNKLGLTNQAEYLKRAKEKIDDPEWGYLGPEVKAEREQRALRAANMGFGASFLNTSVEAGMDVYALMKQISVLNLPGAGSTLAPYLAKTGLSADKALKVGSAIQRFVTTASFRFVSTPTLDIRERATNAAWMTAYNLTPYVAVGVISKMPMPIVQKIPGASLGVKAFFVDVLLNTALTSRTYKDLGDKYGWFSPEFLSEAMPQFIMDVGMAWSTRNFPLYDRDRETQRLAENISRMHHAERGGNLQTMIKDQYNLIKNLNQMSDSYDKMYSVAHLSNKYGDIKVDDKGNLTRESLAAINKIANTNIKSNNPEEVFQSLILQGQKFSEDSPLFRTSEQIRDEQKKTSVSHREESKNIVKELLDKRIRPYLEEMQIGLSVKDIAPRIADLYGRGLTVNEIAKRLNVSESSVREVIKISPFAPDLTQEARKYKSAEEFVKAQGTPIYHGTNYANARQIQQTGLNPESATSIKGDKKFVFLTGDEQYAKSYATQKGGDNSFVLSVKKPADTIIEESTYKKGMKFPDLVSQKAIPPEDIIIKGKDGKWYPIKEFNFFTGEADTYIGKTPVEIKTKSQLEDIWKKANQATPESSLTQEAKKYKSAEEFVKAQEAPKTVTVWNKSKFSNEGAYTERPVIRKVENKTLYQGGDDSRQFWTPNKKYAEQFGNVKEKTGTFYQIDNGNRMTDVYVDASKTKSQLTDIWNKAVKGVEAETIKSPDIKIEIAENIKPGTPLSQHFEKVKEDYFGLVEGLGYDKVHIVNQIKRSIKYIESSPSEAVKVAFGLKEPPGGILRSALQISMVSSLRAAGKYEMAESISRRASFELTRAAQELNMGKIDVPSAGPRRIEAVILADRLEKIGQRIPEGETKLSPRERAEVKIKNEAALAARKTSFEMNAIGKAEGLLSEIELSLPNKTKLIDAFSSEGITIRDLYERTSEQNRAFFEKYLDKETALKVNADFERSLLSNQKQSISNWVWKYIYEGKPLYQEITFQQAKSMFSSGMKAKALKKMSSQQRITTLSKFVGLDVAEKLNERFEKSIRSGTLAGWEERAFGSKDLYEHQKLNRALSKLELLGDLGVLNEKNMSNFLEDFIAIKLGVSLTPRESKKIYDLSQEISTSYDKIENNWTWENKKEVKEYFRKRKELSDYSSKLSPSSNMDVFTSVGARGSILFSTRSAMNSLIYQIVPGITRSVAKRVISPLTIPGNYRTIDRMHVALSGIANLQSTKFWREQTKMGIEIYKETGYDISRLSTLEDGFRYFGEKYTSVSGPTWGESRGIAEKFGATVRGHARLVQPALKYAAGGTDAIFANAHRSGTTALLSRLSSLLEQKAGELPEGVSREQREKELIKESLSFNPKDVKAQYIRQAGILDAHHANFTANDFYGKLSIGIRNAIPFGIGKTIAPFAKISANALGKGFEATGPGLIIGTKRIINATRMQPGADKSIEISEGLSQIMATGGLLGAAIFITSLLDKEDFIGPYDYTKRSENQLSLTKNAGANYIRIGDKWVSLRWFGPLSIPMSAIISARLAKADGEVASIGYARGIMNGLLDFPVIKEFAGVYGSVKEASTAGTINQFMRKMGLDMNSIKRWTEVRTIPSFISHDFQGLMDETKYDALGRPIPEKTFRNFIIGSNIKQDTSNMITKEFDRLLLTGNLPVLSNPTGENIKWLEYVADKLDSQMHVEFMAGVKTNYATKVEKLIQSPKYKKMEPDDQKKAIDNIRQSEILDKIKKRAEKLKKEIPEVYRMFNPTEDQEIKKTPTRIML